MSFDVRPIGAIMIPKVVKERVSRVATTFFKEDIPYILNKAKTINPITDSNVFSSENTRVSAILNYFG